MWTIGFKQGKQEGYTAGYMKGRTVGRSSVDTKWLPMPQLALIVITAKMPGVERA